MNKIYLIGGEISTHDAEVILEMVSYCQEKVSSLHIICDPSHLPLPSVSRLSPFYCPTFCRLSLPLSAGLLFFLLSKFC